jgi:rare lipoprotein A
MTHRMILLATALLAAVPARADIVTASWYGGRRHEGRLTASGCVFHAGQMTAASRTLPLGTVLRLERGGRAVVVVVSDRGPFIGHRHLDLSRGAAARLGMLNAGVAPVQMRVVGFKPLRCQPF